MGIDADIRVYTEPTEELMRKLADLVSLDPVLMSPRAHVDEQHRPYIHIPSMSRFYGPNYRRGDWPAIKAALFAVREVCPPGSVWYGGDYREWHVPTDEALFELLDATWEQYGADY